MTPPASKSGHEHLRLHLRGEIKVEAMSPAEAQLYLARVLMPLCEVFPDASLYANALSIADETGYSFYDALIVGSAIAAGCQVLLHEDLQHRRTVRGVEIQNPFLGRA